METKTLWKLGLDLKSFSWKLEGQNLFPKPGIPNCWSPYLMIWGGVDVIIIEIKCTINAMCLNYPKTTHPRVHGKTVLHKTGPWCQKGWEPLQQGATECPWGKQAWMWLGCKGHSTPTSTQSQCQRGPQRSQGQGKASSAKDCPSMALWPASLPSKRGETRWWL